MYTIIHFQVFPNNPKKKDNLKFYSNDMASKPFPGIETIRKLALVIYSNIFQKKKNENFH